MNLNLDPAFRTPRADLSELTAEQIYSEAVAQGIITPKPSPRPKLKRGNQLRIF
jgi:hypothetical protein